MRYKKFKEAKFISDFIKNEGLKMLWLLIQQQVLHHPIIMTSQEKRSQKVMAHLGKRWSQSQKGEKIDYMKDAVAAYVVKL